MFVYNTCQKIKLFDWEYFFKNFRMDTRTFEDLLSCVIPIVQKSSLQRSTTTLTQRLCFTLRFLATGDFQTIIGTTQPTQRRRKDVKAS